MNGGFYKSIIDDGAFPRQKYHCKDYRTKVILLIIFLTIPTSVEAHKMHLQNKVTPKSCK
jgi:hypothetical protein